MNTKAVEVNKTAKNEYTKIYAPYCIYIPTQGSSGREADHSPPASAEVKKMWISPIRLHSVVLN
jgi:hypothetical protein